MRRFDALFGALPLLIGATFFLGAAAGPSVETEGGDTPPPAVVIVPWGGSLPQYDGELDFITFQIEAGSSCRSAVAATFTDLDHAWLGHIEQRPSVGYPRLGQGTTSFVQRQGLGIFGLTVPFSPNSQPYGEPPSAARSLEWVHEWPSYQWWLGGSHTMLYEGDGFIDLDWQNEVRTRGRLLDGELVGKPRFIGDPTGTALRVTYYPE